jgi:hypothetical protein
MFSNRQTSRTHDKPSRVGSTLGKSDGNRRHHNPKGSLTKAISNGVHESVGGIHCTT